MIIKALWDRWLDIAAFYRPSVLVLDNLDRVVGPEVEVGHECLSCLVNELNPVAVSMQTRLGNGSLPNSSSPLSVLLLWRQKDETFAVSSLSRLLKIKLPFIPY